MLSELIINQHRQGADIGNQELLAHYQRWRRFDNVAMMTAMSVLNRLFSNTSLPIVAARGVGLWAVGKLPKLKRFFMRDAMGLVGDLPKVIKKVI